MLFVARHAQKGFVVKAARRAVVAKSNQSFGATSTPQTPLQTGQTLVFVTKNCLLCRLLFTICVFDANTQAVNNFNNWPEFITFPFKFSDKSMKFFIQIFKLCNEFKVFDFYDKLLRRFHFYHSFVRFDGSIIEGISAAGSPSSNFFLSI